MSVQSEAKTMKRTSAAMTLTSLSVGLPKCASEASRDDSTSLPRPNCEKSGSVYAQLFIAAPVVCVCVRALGAITKETSVSH